MTNIRMRKVGHNFEQNALFLLGSHSYILTRRIRNIEPVW